VASWTVLEEQVVWIAARATAFTVVCDTCARLIAADGYGAATVRGELPLERMHGTIECPRGHSLRVERKAA
jgi:hypothetical protein